MPKLPHLYYFHSNWDLDPNQNPADYAKIVELLRGLSINIEQTKQTLKSSIPNSSEADANNSARTIEILEQSIAILQVNICLNTVWLFNHYSFQSHYLPFAGVLPKSSC